MHYIMYVDVQAQVVEVSSPLFPSESLELNSGHQTSRKNSYTQRCLVGPSFFFLNFLLVKLLIPSSPGCPGAYYGHN